MKLLTTALIAQLIRNGEASQEHEVDLPPVVKLFTPDANATWLLTEIDPEDGDRAFGLCDLGLGCPEIGYVSLAELGGLRGPMGLKVERDLHFNASKTLAEYATEARSYGRLRA